MIDRHLFGYDGPVASSYAAASARQAGASAREAFRSAQDLEDRHERLALVCMALWSLLMDKTDLTERDLIERVGMLDRVDGVEDGKATQTVRKCTACHRTMSPRHSKCLYCGREALVSSAFDRV